jgi:acyl carrier protein
VGASDKQIVAYVVGSRPQLSQELRGYLKEQLPEYMMPTAFVMLDELPLTTSGKVDRRALPAPDSARHDRSDAPVVSTTPVQELLAGILMEVMEVAHVRGEDNFFELGGHSLLATRLMARLQETFNVEIPLRALFETPNVKALVKYIEESVRNGYGLHLPPLTRVSRSSELPLSFAQQRLWFMDQLEPESAFYNIPAVVRLIGKLNARALAQSLTELQRRHEVLRTTFATVDGRAVQVISATPNVDLLFVDLRGLAGDERQDQSRCLTEAEAGRPFNLSRGPLLRTLVMQLSATEHVVVLTMHHIISDGWTMDLLIQELSTLYESYCRGEASPLKELALQYADYAVWQREWLQGEVLATQLQYWRNQLAGELPVLNLPADYPRPAIESFSGKSQLFEIEPELIESLQTISRSEGVTLFMTLLAGFKALLYGLSNQTDIVVGTPAVNRNLVETEKMMGFFINMLVMRTQLAGSLPFKELLKRVKEVALGAYAHQDLPFEKLVEELGVERDAAHSPLFQVTLGFDNTPQQLIETADMIMSYVELNRPVVRYDLTLWIIQNGSEASARWTYRTDLFKTATIQRLHASYLNLLRRIILEPETRLIRLKMYAESVAEEIGERKEPSIKKFRQTRSREDTAGIEIHADAL